MKPVKIVNVLVFADDVTLLADSVEKIKFNIILLNKSK